MSSWWPPLDPARPVDLPTARIRTGPASSDASSGEEDQQIFAMLDRVFNVVITDSRTGLVHSAIEGTLKLAGSLIADSLRGLAGWLSGRDARRRPRRCAGRLS